MDFIVQSQPDKEKVIAYIGKLPEGKRYHVRISLKREKRTVDQNSLYWLWIACIMDETGNEKEFLHEFFKGKFLGYHERVVFGQVVKTPKTTTTLDTKQFTNYLEEIRVFAAAELGIVLPDPEDKYWQDFYDKYKLFLN